MSVKSLPYAEGDVFAVPLRDGQGWARCVVARVAPRGAIVFGFFFGPKFEAAADASVNVPCQDDAVLVRRFGGLGIVNGEWKRIGSVESWQRERWGMPAFVKHDPLRPGRAYSVVYADDDPSLFRSETPTDEDAAGPSDGMAGYGFIEITLTRLLAAE